MERYREEGGGAPEERVLYTDVTECPTHWITCQVVLRITRSPKLAVSQSTWKGRGVQKMGSWGGGESGAFRQRDPKQRAWSQKPLFDEPASPATQAQEGRVNEWRDSDGGASLESSGSLRSESELEKPLSPSDTPHGVSTLPPAETRRRRSPKSSSPSRLTSPKKQRSQASSRSERAPRPRSATSKTRRGD